MDNPFERYRLTNRFINILLIEDESGDIFLMKQMFASIEGFNSKLEVRSTLKEGLNRVQEGGIDLILLDLSLPDSRGIETFTKIHDKAPQMPIILLTGYDDRAMALSLVRQGAQDYLVKGETDNNLLRRSILYAIEREKIEEKLQKNYDIQKILNDLLKLSLENLPLKEYLKQAVNLIGSISWLSYEKKALIFIYEPAESEHILVINGYDEVDPFIIETFKDHIRETCCCLPGPEKDKEHIIGCLSKNNPPVNHDHFCSIIKYHDHPIGLIDICLNNATERGSQERDLFTSISNTLAGIIVHKRTEEQNKRHLQRSESLRTIELSITENLDLNLVLEVFLRELVKQLKIDAADLLLLSSHTNILEWCIGHGFSSKALQYTKLKLGEGIAGKAALEREIVKVENLPQNMHMLRNSKTLPEENFSVYIAVPLIARGEVKGVLEIFHRTELNTDKEWLSFLEDLGTHAAIAIDNANLFNRLQQSNLELTLAYDSSIEGWAHALDLRDKDTEGHSRRVTDMTLKMAIKKGVNDSDLIHIKRGALLHDIGKMGIPDHILLKPGPLNKEEWEIMKRHPVYAHELLSPIKYLRPAIEIPYCHHEKWNGSGYPRGISGTTIPLSARIFTIVDVWDALSSDRPYGKRWEEAKVFDHIRSLKGKDFEPQMVDLFFDCVKDQKKSK